MKQPGSTLTTERDTSQLNPRNILTVGGRESQITLVHKRTTTSKVILRKKLSLGMSAIRNGTEKKNKTSELCKIARKGGQVIQNMEDLPSSLSFTTHTA